MAEKSDIAWTTSTFNPFIGCTKVSPGCDGCYAEALDKRHKWGGAVHWGAGVPRYRTSENLWKQPLAWERKQTAMLAADPATSPWRVFCASLADVFDNEVPQAWRDDLWQLVSKTPSLSWLIVTKRIGNVAKMVPPRWTEFGFPEQVRLMVTVVDQAEADRDVPKLLSLACKNGISYEPALGPVDWSEWLCDGQPTQADIDHPTYGGRHLRYGAPRLQWIIVGGESSQGAHKARPFMLHYAEDAVRQCKAAGVPVFVKQLGSRPIHIPRGTGHKYDIDDPVQMEGACFELQRILDGSRELALKDRAGADPAEWPEDLRVQEFPA